MTETPKLYAEVVKLSTSGRGSGQTAAMLTRVAVHLEANPSHKALIIVHNIAMRQYCEFLLKYISKGRIQPQKLRKRIFWSSIQQKEISHALERTRGLDVKHFWDHVVLEDTYTG